MARGGGRALTTVVVVALAALNLLSFALFGVDKAKARLGRRRIPERTLIGSGLVSGTLGAWLGVVVFRHKRSKPSFLVRLAGASAVDAALLALVLALR